MNVKLKINEVKKNFFKKIENLESFNIKVYDDILQENIRFEFIPIGLSYEILYKDNIIWYILVDDFEIEIIFKKLNYEEVSIENVKYLIHKMKKCKNK